MNNKKAFAEQLLANPLFGELLDKVEKDAVESLIHADTEQKRVEAQWRVRSARTFRSDCEYIIHSNQTRKGAVA